MNRTHNMQSLLDTLAPEVEAGPCSTQHAAPSTPAGGNRRDPEARILFRGALIILCAVGLAVSLLRDAEVRYSMPPPPPVAVEPGAATSLAIARSLAPGQSHCIQDWREGDCYRCAHRTESGDAVGGYAC